MNIYFGSDHAGYELKEVLVSFVRELGYEVEDLGAHELVAGDDYPDVVLPVARKVADEGGMGIVLGGSGQGEAMAANRVRGARATVFYGGDTEVLVASRADNDANILSLGARFMGADLAKEAVRTWLAAPFSDEERHARRIGKLDAV